MSSHAILEAIEISKFYSHPTHTQILNTLSFKVEAGETIAITGKSGEGKSTLLNILGTLEKPSSGQLLMRGKPISDLSYIRNRQLGFIFQSFNLLEDYTVFENVIMPARIGRLSVDYNIINSLIEEVGLSHRLHYPTKLLSGGEKQRVAIARALCNDPDLILADEPSGNLDHAHSIAIHQLLIQSAKKRNKAVVLVTHDKELASLCDHRYILLNGDLQCIF
jgi:lipoprotein-releasing system ATP-binding protein